jgi:hypothetical protein
LGLGTLLGTFAKLTILRGLIGNIAVVTTGSPGGLFIVAGDARRRHHCGGRRVANSATLLNEAFHYATKSRSPAVTT